MWPCSIIGSLECNVKVYPLMLEKNAVLLFMQLLDLQDD